MIMHGLIIYVYKALCLIIYVKVYYLPVTHVYNYIYSIYVCKVYHKSLYCISLCRLA